MGKPLISDAVMRGMYSTMQALRTAKRDPAVVGMLPARSRAAVHNQPEALLAALLSQLHRRDTLLTHGPAPLAQAALRAAFEGGHAPTLHSCECTADECAAVATGMSLKRAGQGESAGRDAVSASRPVSVALLSDFPPMHGVLRLIEQHDLPVLLVIMASPETRADAQKRLQSTKVPVMQVDWSDAVAVCRVAQECLLRARSGWGRRGHARHGHARFARSTLRAGATHAEARDTADGPARRMSRG